MDISGEYDIPADRQTVWQALNDPEVLKACIPGCQDLTATDEGEGGGYAAKVRAKVGPVQATFNGHVRLEDINAPEGYTIIGEGKGGAAGFAKGSAKIHLMETEDGRTRLHYTADAQVGGKLAQVGSRLIKGTAQKYADDFFTALTQRLTVAEAPPAEAETAPEAAEPAPAPAGAWPAWAWWATGVVVLVLIIIALTAG